MTAMRPAHRSLDTTSGPGAGGTIRLLRQSGTPPERPRGAPPRLLGLLLAAAFVSSGSGVAAAAGEQATPLVLSVAKRLIPVLGSDGLYHAIYELELRNMTRRRVVVQHVDVLDARTDSVVLSLDGAEVARRLVVRQEAPAPGALEASQAGILYLHLALESKLDIPDRLAHDLVVVADAFGTTPIRFAGGHVRLASATELLLEPPLKGKGFVAGDGCCDSVRHVRATLPINGELFTAQRYAIDWEKVDDQNRIAVGDLGRPSSYHIYGEPAYAVAPAEVVEAVDGLPDSPPGALPSGLPIDQVDGNHVILDLGDGRYALYAHFKPGSVRVRKGERVRAGQVLGLVGTSGNSSEPHLHFHVMDGPSALASSGVPYTIRRFRSTERGVSTEAFDEAIATGRPLAVEPVQGPRARSHSIPLDLWIVDFP